MDGMAITAAIASIAAFALTALALAIGEPLARRFRLLDIPGGRKDHRSATPVTGGPAIILGIALPCMLILPLSQPVLGLLAAGMILTIIGILDDLHDIPWYFRIGAQIAAALVMIFFGGVRVELIGEVFSSAPVYVSPVFVIPLTVIATVGLINALNMCDGVDGLAGSQVLVALLMLSAAAFYSGNHHLAQGLVVISGGIVAFLMFNMRTPWHPHARAFLGNSGSAFLGLIIAWSCFRLTQDLRHPITPVLAPFFIALPVIDCLVLMARRVAHRRSPFFADRTHMHHILIDGGWRPTVLVLVLAALSLAIGLTAAASRYLGVPTYVFPIAFIGLIAGYFAITFNPSRSSLRLAKLRRKDAS